MTSPDSNAASDSATYVANALRDAFAEVASADLEPETKGRWQRRLLAITNTSKHDVARAAEQLNTFHVAWNAAKNTVTEARDR